MIFKTDALCDHDIVLVDFLSFKSVSHTYFVLKIQYICLGDIFQTSRILSQTTP
jgi:hypothetical protein